jgi:hypothetical protein
VYQSLLLEVVMVEKIMSMVVLEVQEEEAVVL